MDPKTYKAPTGATTVTVFTDAGEYPLDPRRDIINHSPDGCSWGYGGSGPAQLALGLLCDHLEDDEQAETMYQQFKWEMIATLERDAPFHMSSAMIEAWVRNWKRNAARAL